MNSSDLFVCTLPTGPNLCPKAVASAVGSLASALPKPSMPSMPAPEPKAAPEPAKDPRAVLLSFKTAVPPAKTQCWDWFHEQRSIFTIISPVVRVVTTWNTHHPMPVGGTVNMDHETGTAGCPTGRTMAYPLGPVAMYLFISRRTLNLRDFDPEIPPAVYLVFGQVFRDQSSLKPQRPISKHQRTKDR